MKLMLRCALAVVVLATAASVASANTIYTADFSQIVQIDHTNNGNPLESSPQSGANFTIGYPSIPSSDSTRNFFETDGDSLISSDFGGDHWMYTDDIDVSGWNEVEIDILAGFVGTASFNNSPTEFIEYYYSLDNGPAQQFFYFTDDPNGSNLNANTTVDVTGISTLVVGVNANVDGAGDGWDMTRLEVDGTQPVPEPGFLVLALTGLVTIGAVRRRRRQ